MAGDAEAYVNPHAQ